MSFIDRIKYFVCSLSIILCNGLNSAAMYNDILMTPNGPYGLFFRNNPCYASKKANLPNAITTGMKDYAVIYKYVDIPDNLRLQNECCSSCEGGFENSKFECHSTNIKYRCIANQDNSVDCIFIPIPKGISIENNNNLIDLYCKSDLKLCYNCMGRFLEPYLKNLSEPFHEQCEEKEVNSTILNAFKMNKFKNNKRFSMLPKEFRFLPNENHNNYINNALHQKKCSYCKMLVMPNSSKPVLMCCDGHLCHVICFLRELIKGRNPELKSTPPKNFKIYQKHNMCVCGKPVNFNGNELFFINNNQLHCLHLNCLLEYFHCPYTDCQQKMKYVCPYFNTIDMMKKKNGINLSPLFDIIFNMTNH